MGDVTMPIKEQEAKELGSGSGKHVKYWTAEERREQGKKVLKQRRRALRKAKYAAQGRE